MHFKEKLQILSSMGFRDASKTVVRHLLFGRNFAFFEKFGVHILPVHYGSPIPDTRELRKRFNLWYKESDLTGIDMNTEEQLKLLNTLQTYQTECDELFYGEVARHGFGPGYGEVESHILHSMIRYLKPHTIVEVGSGVSTSFSVNALSLNKGRDGINSKMISIEPYPRSQLRNIQGDCEIKIIPKLIQDINIEFFKILDEGDILFIDSSHIVKVASDVNFLYLDVLPNLKKGVVIHMHDIPFPYPTPDPEYWIFRAHQFWTESALLQAFLAYNSAFKILLCSSYLHYKKPKELGYVFKIYDPARHFPSSIWLQKVR